MGSPILPTALRRGASTKPTCPAVISARSASPEEASGLTDYPETPLMKLATTTLLDSGSPFATLVKNFTWTNADQNAVAADIEGGMTPDEAAQKWIDANKDTVNMWLEGTGASIS